MENLPAYGLWTLVAINSFIVIMFAYSFTSPKTKRDWRSLGTFAAFIVALFTEMYGFPLTIYLFSGLIQSKYPQIDFFSHDSGHLLNTVLGLQGNPHFSVFHILSIILIFGGFWLLSAAWKVLHQAQQKKTLAIGGPYRYMRHPQYTAFILIMFGFLIQWPTILTLIMFPILVFRYMRLAKIEEKEVSVKFGRPYLAYAQRTPAFFPSIRKYIFNGG